MAVKGWQFIPQRMEELGLTAEDGMTQAWFVAPDGRLSGGAAAVNDALRYTWWGRPLAALYPLPGIRQLEDYVYRWVAENRYRLPGSNDVCEIPPRVEDG